MHLPISTPVPAFTSISQFTYPMHTHTQAPMANNMSQILYLQASMLNSMPPAKPIMSPIPGMSPYSIPTFPAVLPLSPTTMPLRPIPMYGANPAIPPDHDQPLWQLDTTTSYLNNLQHGYDSLQMQHSQLQMQFNALKQNAEASRKKATAKEKQLKMRETAIAAREVNQVELDEQFTHLRIHVMDEQNKLWKLKFLTSKETRRNKTNDVNCHDSHAVHQPPQYPQYPWLDHLNNILQTTLLAATFNMLSSPAQPAARITNIFQPG